MPLAAKRRIDAACAQFEKACERGDTRIEEFLEAVRERERGVLLAELLHIEIERRRKKGETPAMGDYLPRFPGDEAILREVFAQESRPELSASSAPQGSAGQPAQLAGVTIPDYEILEELGRGGMGVVYKARQTKLNRLVALKFILHGKNAQARHQERFRREAEAIARLRHPNIVQIHDFGEAGGQCFLLLEYGDGGNLRDRLGAVPLDPRTAARLLEPLARAVQHAHRHGVIHSDIKPANVLLVEGGDSVMVGNPPMSELARIRAGESLHVAYCVPKLADFGLARLAGEEGPITAFGVLAGTPSYMAPEQADAARETGPAADVWALGATLYECLTGQPPFKGATTAETLRLVREVDPVPPSKIQSHIPRDLETICLKCLEKDPAKRYAGARELAHDLARFNRGDPIESRRAGVLTRAWRWARRWPFLAALLVLAAMVSLVALAWFAIGALIPAGLPSPSR